MTFLPGTTVEFTLDHLGLIGRPETVGAGDLGRVLGPGPDEGWIYVEPCRYPGSICPVWAGMIKVAA